MSVPVGIAGIGTYLPERTMSAAEIGERAGIPEEVVRSRFGVTRKHIAADGEHVSEMSARAAWRALENASQSLAEAVHPEHLDGILYFGSPHKEFPVWLAAPRIQQLLGAARAWAFEVGAVSAGAPYALRVAADMMAADESLRTVLLVGASRESMLLDYTNRRARFMFGFGDGAAAVVLRRGHRANRILRSAFHTDGRFAESVRVPAGGSREPASAASVAAGLHSLDVDDPEAMKQRLDPVTLERFVSVTREAVRRSGRAPNEIRFLATLHTKPSLYAAVLAELGLEPTQSVYLDETGHMSAVDPIFALEAGLGLGRLREGMLTAVLSAGTGYNWAATAIQWGGPGAEQTA